ncbi:MAG: RNA-binding protein [Cyanobacteria bacterium P01_F01_bin.153]
MTIYIGNLSYDAEEEDLRTVFAEYGEVKRVTLPTDRETGRIRGFAFVELANSEDEESAIESLHGAEWMGRELRVNKAKPRENNRPRRNDGGGYGNRDSFGGGGRDNFSSDVVRNPLSTPLDL